MKQGQIASFIQKLDEILENPQYNSIIRWTPQGDAFMITSVTKLTDIVLPKYFKHNNYSSFNRQLNMYQFVKIRCQTDQIYYQNKHFLRFNKEQYKNIKRKIKNQYDDQQYLVSSYAQSPGPLAQLKELQDRQYKLENVCMNIYNQNQTILSQNTKLWKKISQKLNRKSKQLSALLYLLLLRSQNQQIVQYLPLLQNYEPTGEEQDNNNSQSSDNQDIIQHNIPKNKNRSLLGLLQSKNINVQDVITYLVQEKLKNKNKSKNDMSLLAKNIQSENQDNNLYIKQNGQSSSHRAQNEKQPSIISDMNYFLNNSHLSGKDYQDFNFQL